MPLLLCNHHFLRCLVHMGDISIRAIANVAAIFVSLVIKSSVITNDSRGHEYQPYWVYGHWVLDLIHIRPKKAEILPFLLVAACI